VKLFYLDVTFERLAKSEEKNKWSEKKLRYEFNKIKKEAETLSLDNIKEKLDPDDIHWSKRLENLSYEKVKKNTNLLCVDDYHKGIKLHRSEVKRGDLLASLIDKQIKDTRTDSLLKSPHFEFLASNLPIVVRRYGKLFEVMSGNHRALALISKGCKEINVLLVNL
jgi:hypothetical protein